MMSREAGSGDAAAETELRDEVGRASGASVIRRSGRLTGQS